MYLLLQQEHTDYYSSKNAKVREQCKVYWQQGKKSCWDWRLQTEKENYQLRQHAWHHHQTTYHMRNYTSEKTRAVVVYAKHIYLLFPLERKKAETRRRINHIHFQQSITLTNLQCLAFFRKKLSLWISTEMYNGANDNVPSKTVCVPFSHCLRKTARQHIFRKYLLLLQIHKRSWVF